MPARGSISPSSSAVREHLRRRGLRWTPQRRLILDVIGGTDGHVTGAELVERCRDVDAATTPSTVYRTLRVLEEIGVVRHAHGPDGREEFHVRPVREHGHLRCVHCGGSWEIGVEEAAATVAAFREHWDFDVDLGHLTVVGRCAACRGATSRGPSGPATSGP
jgi:Fur family ferric uptake transcriptional regulator